MNKGIDRFEANGRPYSKNAKMVCPNCSKYIRTAGLPGYSYPKAEITSPVFLILKENKKTGQQFLGCPNFPTCKHSDDIFSVRVAKIQGKFFNIDFDDELRPF